MASEPKSFDITKPKSSTDASSKPLIVTNKPVVKDPMVAAGVTSTAKPVEETVEEPKPAAAEPKPVAGETKPASEETKPEADAPKQAADESKEADKEAKPTTVLPSAKPKIVPLTDKEKSDAGLAPDKAEAKDGDDKDGSPSAEDKAAKDNAIVDAVAEQAEAKKADKDTSADVAKQEAVDKLAGSKQYFVPIGIESGKKKSHTGLIIFLLFLLVLVGGYLALDAGLVKVNNVEVPYHIVDQK